MNPGAGYKMDMGIFSFRRAHEPKGYKGIKRTSPAVLALARQVIYDHLMVIVDDGQINESDIAPHVQQCVAQLAAWPEAMAITHLLRDMDIEDFYHA